MNRMKVSFLAAACLAYVLLAGCSGPRSASSSAQEAKSPLPAAFEPGKTLSASFTDSRLPDMAGVAESSRLRLFVDGQKGVVAVLDKESGEVWYSNPPKRDADPLAQGVNKDVLSAQLKMDFYNHLGQINSINSYTDSVTHKQIKWETIPDGVRVTYQFGTAGKTADDMPMKLGKARFQELSGKVDKAGQRALLIAYKEDPDEDVYVRNDSALQGLQLERALQAFTDAGYTEKDLQSDIAALHLNQTKPEPRIFLASIEYSLDGDSLIARIPAASLHYPQDYPVNRIALLSYFGAGGPEEKGSILVPDGSGALIHWNNGKTQYPPYQQLVYGPDETVERVEDASKEQEVRLPVFGMITGKKAFLGIIEEGEAAATIQADVSGRLDSYNSVYPSFYVVQEDKITLKANGQERSLPRFEQSPPKSDFTVRYAFLNGNDASYPGMAKYYQSYLQKHGGLPDPKASGDKAGSDMPFYLKLDGGMEVKKHFAGIPYRSLEPLTTFKQAESIIGQMQERGIRPIRLKYAGWFNQGLDHRVPDRLSVDQAVGGGKALRNFQTFAEQKGVVLFPDVALTMAHSGKGFDESAKASRTLRGSPAAVYPLEPALNRRDTSKSPAYVVSPRVVPGYVDAVLKGFGSYKLAGISLRDLGDRLNSDFRKSQEIDRTESQGIMREALARIRDSSLRIMADGGNAYALPFVTDLTGAPMSSSRFKLEDEEIPFYPMVLHGFIDYTGEPFNLSAYTDDRQYVLKCLEYGAGVYFEWIHEPNVKVKDTEYNGLYAVQYSQWLDQAAGLYKEVNGVLGKVRNQKIVSHEKLGAGLYKTVYGNGVYVIVNYNRSAVQTDGVRIAAESYATGEVQP